MRRAAATAFVATLALAGCLQHEVLDLDGDGGTGPSDTDTDTPTDLHFDKLDLLIVVDDSISMAQEQEMLATSVFDLVSSLAFQLGDPSYLPIEDVRAAVVSTNMGFSANGATGDAFWPQTVPDSCSGLGDDGRFKTSSTSQVVIESGAIPCTGLECHCPPDWACALEDAGLGTCEPEAPADNAVACPASGASYAATTQDDPNEDVSLEVACLTSLGTNGCGFEQQLASAVAAAQRGDQAWFFREDAALGVMVVSDEDDCSMKDNVGLFATEEIQEQSEKKVNLACGLHPEFLYSPKDLHDALIQAKGGVSGAVFFAAIVGVPVDPACEGDGKAIQYCLDNLDMQMIPEQPGGDDDPPNPTWFFRPACTRTVGDEEVTRAYPGRRFVQLAVEFGAQGYVFSICNEDWMRGMEEFAGIIGAAME
jgi:hypothetical protein